MFPLPWTHFREATNSLHCRSLRNVAAHRVPTSEEVESTPFDLQVKCLRSFVPSLDLLSLLLCGKKLGLRITINRRSSQKNAAYDLIKLLRKT
jgi:hypothetical protein